MWYSDRTSIYSYSLSFPSQFHIFFLSIYLLFSHHMSHFFLFYSFLIRNGVFKKHQFMVGSGGNHLVTTVKLYRQCGGVQILESPLWGDLETSPTGTATCVWSGYRVKDKKNDRVILHTFLTLYHLNVFLQCLIHLKNQAAHFGVHQQQLHHIKMIAMDHALSRR